MGFFYLSFRLRQGKMKNEPMAKSLASAEAEAVINRNLEYIFRAEASVYERKFAHLKERADNIARALKVKLGREDIMSAVALSYEAADIYADMRGEKQSFAELFGDVNAPG